MTPNRLICYSLAVGDGPHLDQLLRSVASLRQHNRGIPVRVFVYGELPLIAANTLDVHGVQMQRLGSYADVLCKLSPHGEELSCYRVLPKYISLAELGDLELSQVLCVDCDTFFFTDVARLFDRYQECECYAREEPFSPYSPYPDAAYLDPAALVGLVRSENLHEVPTINTGAFLLNHGLHQKVVPLLGSMLDYLWRLMLGLSERPMSACPLGASVHRSEYRSSDTREDARNSSSPLRSPSSNTWIIDEVAFWLTLGRLKVSWGLFEWQDVLQGQEFLATGRKETQAFACHYFSVNETLFCDWMQGSLVNRDCSGVR